MRITFAPKDVLQVDDAKIVFRNFEGRKGTYNREGERSFALVIPDQDIAEKLQAEKWNVHVKAPREEGDTPFMYLPVKVVFNQWGPIINLRSGKNRIKLTEETAKMIDGITIDHVDLDIAPFDYDNSDGRGTGRAAYLRKMEVWQILDRFEERYQSEEDL